MKADPFPTRELVSVLRGFKRGDFTVRMSTARGGEGGEVAELMNDVVELAARMAHELGRLNKDVGKDGRLAQRMKLPDARGGWQHCADAVNDLIDDLVHPTTEVGRVIGAVASGDLSQAMALEIGGRPMRGEFLRTAKVVNGMVDQLGSFAAEVTRVAREVGSEGKLGGQAKVKGLAGTWKDLTDNVNSMASNLTAQVRNIAEVTTAVAKGDLSKKITVDVKGEILRLKTTINTMVDQLNSFASEVTRVAREVGSEGKLGGQAKVKGVAGTWKDLTDNVNSMASNLTAQVRNIAEVTTAVAKGDLSKKITVDVAGEILQLKNTINTMVDQLNGFASEVTRVAREVGTEGKLGGQAQVGGVAGTWKDLTDSVNSMASNLTAQVRNIAEVTTAVAKGDLSKTITVDVKGEILQLKNTINTMVDQLNGFASEVTRVAREVGTEGKLGGQAQVPGVAGVWKDLTDNVNFMASNLTNQVRNIAEVTTAVAKGDLSKTITVDVKGEILQLKNTINTMVDQLNGFASEVTRVAREVGTEGKLGGQAQVGGVAGTWKDLTDNVNFMASNLTNQVRNIADVTTAVAKGDLSKKITVDVKGEIAQLKDTINTMVDQLRAFAAEVTRVAREVGTEGKLGGQAQVEGVGGTWKDLTDNVNFMASNLTAQVRNIATVTTAVAKGDLTKKITVDVKGEILELKDTINTMVDQLNGFASEVTRVAREVGTEGKLGGQAVVKGVAGTWKGLTDNVNSMASNLTSQVRNIADVTTAVATGDLSRKITVDVKGEIHELKTTINTMVDRLNAFASEVTRVAREVGTEGKLGGQAHVKGVAGTWKDLTDNVNSMASNLTNQVRGIANVVTAVANGDLKRKLALEASGEIAQLADTINSMTDTLAIFADQVTTVAREVGVEGKLGGQAKVPGAAGTWRDLTDNVNQLAGNLTTQVRAIADVATAVTTGDLTRSISVAASGEVAALKENINEMIRNLKDTTRKTTEQDWLKTNLAKFTRMLQGQRDLVTVATQILAELGPLVSAQHGTFYLAEDEDQAGEIKLTLLASYAYAPREGAATTFRLREGLIGQCAFGKQKILTTDVPPAYIRIESGLGAAPPTALIILPVLFEGQVKAVIELASFTRFAAIHEVFLDQLTESIGIVVNTIAASMRTEALLAQSQSLTQELQSQQEELRETNDRLENQAASLRESEERLKTQQDELRRTNDQLGEKAKLLEFKNREVELAKQDLEEKAEQLALTSKYKSQFLANMSHELRTPLNSLLILAKMLTDNADGNLQQKQVKFARTIHGAGTDLLALINDILDLSKIESGTISVEPAEVLLGDLRDYVEQNFRHVAQQKALDFEIGLGAGLPRSIETDAKRLQQVLKNLLSNAFKFTEHGRVTLTVNAVQAGWTRDHESLTRAETVIAFAVTDTGIGIAPDKHKIIFEAFQQSDGTTSRKYGGTGLGLSISRELARVLGGEIRVASEPGVGTTFTLYLPRVNFAPQLVTPGPAALAVAAVLPEPVPIELSERIAAGERVLLVIDEDAGFTARAADLAEPHGLRPVVASRGDLGLQLAHKLAPVAIVLEHRLPDVGGWVVLDRLRRDPATRAIPVLMVAGDGDRRRALVNGAAGFLGKTAGDDALARAVDSLVTRPARPRLLVYDRGGDGAALLALLDGVEAELAGSEAELFTALATARPEAIGFYLRGDAALLERLVVQPAGREVPIVVLDDGAAEEASARAAAVASGHVVRMVASRAALLDELTRFLHLELAQIAEAARREVAALGAVVGALHDATVLVVDDDVRNIFALTSVLEAQHAHVVFAENGQDGLAVLDRTPAIGAVLMDIMMPELDGYEVIRRIRAQDRYRRLPIIAVTAKATSADRDKCIEAGASDYIAKPVDLDRLYSLMRVWLAS